ncbi:hypothetical protein RB195_000160 [Necator americanus]|uniref:EGF-like domain-containing protein n=1 Tax=Necator americanus TaxID=51031 RepID=A0ABR1D9N7_NECAM
MEHIQSSERCLHSGILDKNRCTCPPGAYALNCEPRGCMPSVQANMDTTHQSFILVMNLRSTMAYDLHLLIGQMPTWISDINKAAPGLIDNYLVTTYLQYKDTYYMKNQTFTTSADMLEYLNGLVISAGDDDQPTIAAINSAQSFSSLMHPTSVVYVFADSLDSSDIPYNPKLSSNSIEINTIQVMLSWRNKLVILLSETDDAPMDYFGDYYDIFRRVVKATQGDLIVYEKENAANIIDQLLPYYYQMENMAALYGISPQDDVVVNIRADYPSQVVYILITAENSPAPGVLDQNGSPPKPETSGRYFKLFRTTATAMPKITVTSKRNASTNVRVWINSPNTVFLASNPDPTVDVGSAVSVSELTTYTTAFIAGFVSSVTIATYDMKGSPIRKAAVGSSSRNAECTYPHIFPAAESCTLGPFLQELTFTTDSRTVYRLIPGFCAQPDHPSPIPFSCFNGGTKTGTATCRCTNLFTGRNCATPVCLNGGEVEKFPGNGRPLCECPAGYGGDHCEILSCSTPSTNIFGSTKRSLAVVIQNSFSQAWLNDHINSGLTALLNYMGQADAFDQYILSTYNTITVQGQPTVRTVITPYSTATTFLNATTSAAILYQNSQYETQPSLDALWQTIESTPYDKSSIFLFTDAAPSSSSVNIDITSITLLAIERQLQINVIITAPYQMSSQCMMGAFASIYSQLTYATGGTILNLCEPYKNFYPRDIITEFFTGYGITHHHVETLQEVMISDCSIPTEILFYIDDPSTQVYAFVNSVQIESFNVDMADNDSGPKMYSIPSQVLTPFFGIYQIFPTVYNRLGYTLRVQAAPNSTLGSCSVRIVEKTQLAAYLGFTSDPSKDSPSQTLTYATSSNPVVHVSSQFQSDVQPNIVFHNSDETVRYNATGTRRLPSCHYESFYGTPFTCNKLYSYFLATITLQTNEATMQRTQRAYCYLEPTVCLNGGTSADDNTCNCRPGFNGAKCESPICQNGGVVVDYKCVCEAGYTGQFCQYVACQEWNYLETHDVRQHEFRQITFVVEKNIGMVLPTVYLQQMIASFVNETESNNIPKQYSLVTFDENVVTNVVSTSNTDQFVNIFNNALNNSTNTDPVSTLAGQAIEEAYKITIQPPSIIYLFTSHNFTKFSNTIIKQRLGTQVNIFSMQLQTYPQQPNDFRVPMIARQSGGRLLPLTVLAARDLLRVLVSAVKENALLYDDGFKDCTTQQTVSFFVESTASRVILDITGNDVTTNGAVSVTDGQGNAVPVKSGNALMNDAAALVVEFPLKSGGPVGGKWTVTIKTTSGSCFIQARTESPIHVIPGFSSSRDVDVVKSGPFSTLGTNASVYVTARVTNSRDANYGVTLDSLTITNADYSAPWNDKPLTGQSIHPRDPVGCANQFVTDVFSSPKTTYQKYMITGTDNKGTQFQRTFFFSQPATADSTTQCVNGTRNAYGECICSNRYTGDFCSDRVCLNGGTASLGTCVCVNGYFGDFCENALTDSTTSTSTKKPATKTTTRATTASVTNSPTTLLLTTERTSKATTSNGQPTSQQTTSRTPTARSVPVSTTTSGTSRITSTVAQKTTAGSGISTLPISSSVTQIKSSTQITSIPPIKSSTNKYASSTPLIPTSSSFAETTSFGSTGPPPVCFPATTTFMISFLIDASNPTSMFLNSQENVIQNVAQKFDLGSGQQQTRFVVSGMAETYISGGDARNIADIDSDFNKIVDDDNFGQMILNVGESLQGYQSSPESSITCCGPPFVVVFMGQRSNDSIQDGYTNLHSKGYELLAIDMTTDTIAPTLTPIFGEKNVKSYTGTLNDLTDWIQNRICRLKYSELLK